MSASLSHCTCLICQPDAEIAADTVMSQTIRAVGEHGWTVLTVHGDDDDEPDWAYTVGLWHKHRVSELSMFGLDAEDMIEWLNRAGHLIAAGARPTVGTGVEGIIDGVELQIRPVDIGWHEGLFGRLVDFYKQQPPMRQLIWPDRKGRLPWDDGATMRAREWQPRLWVPVEQHDIGPWREYATDDAA